MLRITVNVRVRDLDPISNDLEYCKENVGILRNVAIKRIRYVQQAIFGQSGANKPIHQVCFPTVIRDLHEQLR